MKKILTLFACSLLFLSVSAIAQAAPMNWSSGEQQLASPNDLFHAEFELTETREIVIYTKAGEHFNAGAYLWDENKNYLKANENGYAVTVSHNGATDKIRPEDAVIRITLGPGIYYMTLAPMVDGEYANGMGATTMDALIAHRDAKPPRDFTGFGDGSGKFSFHVLGVDDARPYTPAVPIPASALLVAPGLAALGFLKRKLS